MTKFGREGANIYRNLRNLPDVLAIFCCMLFVLLFSGGILLQLVVSSRYVLGVVDYTMRTSFQSVSRSNLVFLVCFMNMCKLCTDSQPLNRI